MKRINISIMLSLLTVAFARAQYLPGARLLTVTGGYTLMQIEETSNSVNGFETGGSFEQTSYDSKWAYGVSVTFIRVTDESTNGKSIYRTTPITFQGKYLFGSPVIKGYVQTNLGIHSSEVEWDGTVVNSQNWDFGFVMGGGAGFQWYLSDKVFITGGYNIKWLHNSYYNEGLAHTFQGGLGFLFP